MESKACDKSSWTKMAPWQGGGSLGSLLDNVQRFCQALPPDRSKTTRRDSPVTDKTARSQLGRKFCKNFAAQNRPKAFRILGPQGLWQENGPARSKLEVWMWRAPKNGIKHDGQGNQPERQSNNRTEQLNTSLWHSCGFPCFHMAHCVGNFLFHELRLSNRQVVKGQGKSVRASKSIAKVIPDMFHSRVPGTKSADKALRNKGRGTGGLPLEEPPGTPIPTRRTINQGLTPQLLFSFSLQVNGKRQPLADLVITAQRTSTTQRTQGGRIPKRKAKTQKTASSCAFRKEGMGVRNLPSGSRIQETIHLLLQQTAMGHLHFARPIHEGTTTESTLLPGWRPRCGKQKLMENKTMFSGQGIAEIRPNSNSSPGKPLGKGRLHTAQRQPGCKQHGPNGACPKWGPNQRRNAPGQGHGNTHARRWGECRSHDKGQHFIHSSAVVGQMHTGDAQRFRERRHAHSATQMGMPNMTVAPCSKAISIKPKSRMTKTTIRFGHQEGQAAKFQHGDSISRDFFAGDGSPHFLERNNLQVQLKAMQSSYCQFQGAYLGYSKWLVATRCGSAHHRVRRAHPQQGH